MRESYTEQLIEWGESGSFYPNLQPSIESLEGIRSVQNQLINHINAAKIVEKPHLTLFYIKPKQLLEYLHTNTGANIEPEWLYMELSNVFATLALTVKPIEVPIRGIERFGPDGRVLGLSLDTPLEFIRLVANTKEMIKIALRRSGMAHSELAVMEQDPAYQWTLGESAPHVSLLTIPENTPVPEVPLPKILLFDGLSDGGVQTPAEDPARWYIMPTSISD